MVTFLNDSTLIYVSDKYGQKDLFMVRSADPEEPNLFKSLKHETVRLTDTDGEEQRPNVSPNLEKIAYVVDRGRLVVADISADGDLSNENVLLDGWDFPGALAWSPDSKWLAYQLSDLYFNSEIYHGWIVDSKSKTRFDLYSED